MVYPFYLVIRLIPLALGINTTVTYPAHPIDQGILNNKKAKEIRYSNREKVQLPG